MTTPEKSFSDRIAEFRKAGFSCLMIVSREEQVAEVEICKAIHGKETNTGKILRFSVASALQEILPTGKVKMVDDKMTDPTDLMAGLPSALGKMDEGKTDKTSVIILPDFCEFLKRDAVLRRMFRERIWWSRSVGHQIILLTENKVELPDLMSDITVISHGLPDRDTTAKTLRDLATEYKAEMSPEEEEVCLESLAGMTSVAQGDAISLALVAHGKKKPIKISPKILQDNKEREISRRGYLTIVKPNVGFDDVVGLTALKDWAKIRRRGFTRAAREFGITTPPKGMLLVGPPGVGKSLTAKAVAKEWGMPLLQLRFSALFSSMLGETESNVRDAIEVAERMAPCVLWCDEINRAFGGDGERDGGTQQRVTGEFLQWLSEKTSLVFVLATANDVTNMPPEMLRRGRFDECWSVSTPSTQERAGIFALYLNGKKNSVNTVLMAEKTEGFIPAEIEGIVTSSHLAAFERHCDGGDPVISDSDIIKEIEGTVPLCKSMAEKFDFLKDWSEKNARPATYRKGEDASNSVRRLNVVETNEN